jgi:NAD(P)-dependent dehydrogenase (short-subunit alcohol dehydrogenase family)
MYYSDKIAIVTGGASGIGRFICVYLGCHGARVIVADRNLDGARETESLITSSGGYGRAVYVDVTDPTDIESLIGRTVQDQGRIDFLFSNAGIGINGEFQDTSLDLWQQILNVNLWGVVYGCHYAYPIMIKQGSGQIVNTASLAGLIPGGLTSSYSTTKHAVVGFTLTLRAEAKQYGIKVNALCPGYMRTGIQGTSRNVSKFLDAEANRDMNQNMRFPTPEDCIDQIMRGVKRDRGIIIAPRGHKVFWWLSRALPDFNPRMWAMAIKHMKKQAQNQQGV